ncbi:MAG: NAD(P)-binding protein [Lachnospiraceae bacterium]|nr:NAD(P)-binding protein [Lachnospiraceae bacterium]
MIRIGQLKAPVGHGPKELKHKAARLLKVKPEEVLDLSVRKQSLDARKKPQLFYIYTVDVKLGQGKNPKKALGEAGERAVVHRAKNNQVTVAMEKRYQFVQPGKEVLAAPPVVVGAGPAGLFCGWMLARYGYRPLLLERGEDVDARQRKVSRFWETGILDPNSNVQFGEGGAGAFSDGKLNTLVKDPDGRARLVLEIFHRFGADGSILYQNKPHIGTDALGGIVKRMREDIVRLGGQVRFNCQVTDLVVGDGQILGVVAGQEAIDASAVVLAIGHSARDTYSLLYRLGVPMSPKAFAVGLRIQHPQALINRSQYGCESVKGLGAADYKLTAKASGGRGVYSFCMCPGGYVVNASSEPGRLAVNGMSYHARDGKNANSALIVSVGPQDFLDPSPLAGIRFQRHLEEAAYQAAGGKVPVQLYGDFKAGRGGTSLGDVEPQMKGAWDFANLREVLPEPLNAAFLEGMERFARTIEGFGREDAVLAGVESRTSSPVRIWRGTGLESAVKGLYPCGEGAGYAGGITSAAMDGVRVAEAIAEKYRPLDPCRSGPGNGPL